MKQAIFLCGFMGAGKSTVGKALAQELGWPLLDTDQIIEERHGPIPAIFAKQGEAYFRRLEADLAQELASAKRAAVISTGGGFVLSQAVQENLKGSCVVYLQVPFEECYERIKDSDRPLVQANSKEQLHEIFKKRDEIYRLVASVCVENSGMLSKTVAQIVESWK